MERGLANVTTKANGAYYKNKLRHCFLYAFVFGARSQVIKGSLLVLIAKCTVVRRLTYTEMFMIKCSRKDPSCRSNRLLETDTVAESGGCLKVTF